ncbi:hypothetical protein U1Q18_029376 [Sarracenia purpurea var. burkii]
MGKVNEEWWASGPVNGEFFALTMGEKLTLPGEQGRWRRREGLFGLENKFQKSSDPDSSRVNLLIWTVGSTIGGSFGFRNRRHSDHRANKEASDSDRWIDDQRFVWFSESFRHSVCGSRISRSDCPILLPPDRWITLLML